MPLLIIVVAIIIVVFVVRLVVGLFTKPLQTLARLGSWACNLIGLLSLVVAILAFSLQVGWIEGEPHPLVTIGASTATIIAFAASAWLTRARRRSELRREYAAHYAAEREIARRYEARE